MIRLQLSNDGAHAEAARLRDLLEKEGFEVAIDEKSRAGTPTIVVRPADDFLPDPQQVEELKVALRELRNLDIAKSQFLANVSHELRTPLTAIVTYGEILRDGLLGELSSRQREAVLSVISSSRQLLSMIEGILTYARTGARAIELDLSEFHVASVVETAYRMSASLIRKKGISFESATEPDLPLVRGDHDKVVHVLTNLIGNAIEFTPSPGGFVHITAGRWDEDPSWIRIGVRDNGIGIDPGNHEMIFREFSQVDSSPARQYHGTGLGLAIARNFITLHGGRIGVQSEVGEGSLFWFTLPSIEANPR
jgi:signal transduction histidine kinase